MWEANFPLTLHGLFFKQFEHKLWCIQGKFLGYEFCSDWKAEFKNNFK